MSYLPGPTSGWTGGKGSAATAAGPQETPQRLVHQLPSPLSASGSVPNPQQNKHAWPMPSTRLICLTPGAGWTGVSCAKLLPAAHYLPPPPPPHGFTSATSCLLDPVDLVPSESVRLPGAPQYDPPLRVSTIPGHRGSSALFGFTVQSWLCVSPPKEARENGVSPNFHPFRHRATSVVGPDAECVPCVRTQPWPPAVLSRGNQQLGVP